MAGNAPKVPLRQGERLLQSFQEAVQPVSMLYVRPSLALPQSLSTHGQQGDTGATLDILSHPSYFVII